MKKNKRHKFAHKPVPQPEPALLPTVDTSFYRAATIVTRPWTRLHIILVGCGAIGSHFAQHLGRLMRTIYHANMGVHLTLCDPDTVAHKNVETGQNFCDAEIGQNKAEALARRLTQAWGLNLSTHTGEFHDGLIFGYDLTVVVGCVDNARARQQLHEVLEANEQGSLSFWWLDLGVGRFANQDVGRVVLGNAYGLEQMAGSFSPDGKMCASLPSPALQFRDLLTPRAEEAEDHNLSCAELVAAGQQGLNIAARTAIEGVITLTQLLVTRDLKAFQVELNTSSRSQRATYATPDEVARVCHKPVSYLMMTQAGVRTINEATAMLTAAL
jgi:PRTRC genetic system ThiF family protein